MPDSEVIKVLMTQLRAFDPGRKLFLKCMMSRQDATTRTWHLYQRFSPSKKRTILAMISGDGVIPLFVSGTFTPSIPLVAEELNTTGATVNLAPSITAFAFSVGGLIAATYSAYYGRRPVYLWSLPVFDWELQGAAPGLVLGPGVIGDIYKAEERGRAISVFLSICSLGPTLAPLLGGSIAFYFSWRTMQFYLAAAGIVQFCWMYSYFPETAQPGTRGIDKLSGTDSNSLKHHPRVIFINPLQPLALLRSPNLLLITLIVSSSLMNFFLLLVPLPYTIGIRYDIPNEILVGACFIPLGLGGMIGAPIAGLISDHIVIWWRHKRKGTWYPEDRLRASLIPLALIVPLPVIAFGFINTFVDGSLGLMLSLICLFINGIGVEMAFGPCAAYLVDVMHSRSAESLAAHIGLRSGLMSLVIASFLPMMDTFGILVTNIICASAVWISFGILCCIIRYGAQMRSWVHIVGYTQVEMLDLNDSETVMVTASASASGLLLTPLGNSTGV